MYIIYIAANKVLLAVEQKFIHHINVVTTPPQNYDNLFYFIS